jgi:hypothetical protein
MEDQVRLIMLGFDLREQMKDDWDYDVVHALVEELVGLMEPTPEPTPPSYGQVPTMRAEQPPILFGER